MYVCIVYLYCIFIDCRHNYKITRQYMKNMKLMLFFQHVRMYVCMYVCMYVYMHLCMYGCMYVCMDLEFRFSSHVCHIVAIS